MTRLFLASLVTFGPAAAACDLTEPETGTVATVIDGETLKLSDGRSVRLIGAKAPMPPLAWRGEDPCPFVEEAKAALESLAAGKMVELRFGGRRSDRHGRLLVQAFVVEGGERLWLQEEMVAKGLARVYSFAGSTACVAELLPREKEARAKRLGIWGVPAYRIIDATDLKRLGRLVHTYQVVEGKIVAVGEGGRAPLSQFRRRLASRLHRQHRAKGGAGLCRRRHRSHVLRRKAHSRPRHACLAERTHDRGKPPGADRASARGGRPGGPRTSIRGPTGYRSIAGQCHIGRLMPQAGQRGVTTERHGDL